MANNIHYCVRSDYYSIFTPLLQEKDKISTAGNYAFYLPSVKMPGETGWKKPLSCLQDSGFIRLMYVCCCCAVT